MMPFPKPILILLGMLTLMSAMAFAEVKSQDLLKSFESMTSFPFERDGDLDGFPDEWYLNKGKTYQAYHTVTLDDKTGMGDSSSLRFGFSGGKVGVFSVPLKLSSRYAYNIRLAKKGKGLGKEYSHRLRFGLRAFDSKDQLLAERYLDELDFSSDWSWTKTLRIPSLPEPTETCQLFVDFSGRPAGDSYLWIDQIEIQSSPSISYEAKAELGTFRPEEVPTFKIVVGGTLMGKTYKLHHTVRRFNGELLLENHQTLEGRDEPHVEKIVLKDSGSGVFYLAAELKLNDEVIVSESRIVARDSVELAKGSSQDIGVLLGHPEPPFAPLLQSLELLGTAISKLDLMDDDFHLGNYSDEEGLPKLNSLLREHAPDKGVRFIARAHGVPQDHQEEGPKGPKHIAETLDDPVWKKTFSSWLRQYGNVLSDWQLGEDNVDLNEDHLSNLQGLVKHLKSEADWMNILLPGLRAGDNTGVPNLIVPSSLNHSKVEALLRSHKSANLHVTLEMRDHSSDQIDIIEDLVIKMAKVESLVDGNGKPLVTMTFIDRLTGKNRGLMTKDYEPHSSYFAAKTLIHWLGGAEPLGRFTHPDSEIDSRVFGRGDQAFAIVWRNGSDRAQSAEPTFFHLGRGLELMDLMGNRKSLSGDPRTGMVVPVGRTPVILITPYRELWETLLSFELVEKNGVKAKVKFQPQSLTFSNQFSKQAKFNLNWSYPTNWEVQPVALEPQVVSMGQGRVDFVQSPSPLFPINRKVPVHVDVEISMEGDQHFAKVFREDAIRSDVKPVVHFYPDGKDLKVEVQILLSEDAPGITSFIASAQLPDGRILEAFFKDLAPGAKKMASLHVTGGRSMIGGELTLTVRESIGERYLLTSHPIKTRF
jgi:hypothetical protein